MKRDMNTDKKVTSMHSKYTSDYIFCILMSLLPLAQFVLFYVVVNFNSVRMAFMKYDVVSGYSFIRLQNFTKAFSDFKSCFEMKQSVTNSILVYFITLITVTPLSLLFSYYIYKQRRFSKFFKLVIFIPTIISSVVFVTIYVNIVDNVIPTIFFKLFHRKIIGLLANIDTRFVTILFYSIWCSFGSTVIIYVSTMSSISESIIEAAKIDGITPIKEFLYIIMPMVYPTFVLFTSIGITGIFTNQINLFSFYGDKAASKLGTLGYYLYKNIYSDDKTLFPYLSALGVLFTLIAVPLVYLVKYLLVKIGPSED